jgi:hypothetical protein
LLTGAARHVLTIALGVALGAVVPIAFGAWQLRKPPSAPPPASPDADGDSAASGAKESALASILYLAAAKNRAAVTAPPEAPAAPTQPTEQRRPAAEHLAKLRAQDEALVGRQATEPYDPDWSPRALTLIRKGLDNLKEKTHFTVGRAECSAFTCYAFLRWQNGTDALTEIHQIVPQSYDLADCTTGLTLPKLDFQAGESVTAPLVFDCSSRKEPRPPQSAERRN